jgi:hypothetical protein
MMNQEQVVIWSGRIFVVTEVDEENGEVQLEGFNGMTYLPRDAEVIEAPSNLKSPFLSSLRKRKLVEAKVHGFLVDYEKKHMRG